MDIQILADDHNGTGENPLYHPGQNKLYWSDIPAGKLFCWDAQTGKREQIYHDRPVGGFTFQQEPDGGFALLLFRDKGNIVVWREGEIVRTIIEKREEMGDTRFNDVIADPAGRVFAGTMPRKQGGGFLYRLDVDGSCRIVDQPVYTANGMGFPLDGKTMLFTETQAKTIWRFDYDQATGELSNKRPLIKVPDGKGMPDGMTIDAAGDIWGAHYGGQGVFRYDSMGKFKEKIDLPAKNITCPTFGGANLDELFVTSAVGDPEPTDESEHAGALFRVKGGVKGRAEYVARIGGG